MRSAIATDPVPRETRTAFAHHRGYPATVPGGGGGAFTGFLVPPVRTQNRARYLNGSNVSVAHEPRSSLVDVARVLS